MPLDEEQLKEYKEKLDQLKERFTSIILEKVFSKEILGSIHQAESRLRSIRLDTQKKYGVKSTAEINTSERTALRNKIIDDLYGEGAQSKERRYDIILGLPASGKSTIAENLKREHGSLLIDSDMVKEKLLEFKGGIGAGIVHEESTILVDRLWAKAVAQKDNIVHPVVGKNIDSIRNLIQAMRQEDYEVKVHYVHISLVTSLLSTYTRYKETGRFISPEYVLSLGSKLEQNCEILIKEGVINEYKRYDNELQISLSAGMDRRRDSREPKDVGRVRRSESKSCTEAEMASGGKGETQSSERDYQPSLSNQSRQQKQSTKKVDTATENTIDKNHLTEPQLEQQNSPQKQQERNRGRGR
jgi:predicted ABC-type ATPase